MTLLVIDTQKGIMNEDLFMYDTVKNNITSLSTQQERIMWK